MAHFWHSRKNGQQRVDFKKPTLVARDGIAQHYTSGMTLPLQGICLSPAA
jgi:hypothetical protein